MIDVCPATGKACYTRRGAMRAARWWRRERLSRMRHYRCKCGSWHIGNDHRKPKRR